MKNDIKQDLILTNKALKSHKDLKPNNQAQFFMRNQIPNVNLENLRLKFKPVFLINLVAE